jgi:hypothetical protein
MTGLFFFVPIGIVVILGTQLLWIKAPLVTRYPNSNWVYFVCSGVVWIALFAYPVAWYYEQGADVLRDLARVEDAANSLLSWYSTWCECYHVDGSKLMGAELKSMIQYLNKAMKFVLPWVIGVTITIETLVLILLGLSLVASSSHLIRMFTFSLVLVLFGTALVGAVALTDAFNYLRTDLEYSDNNVIQLLIGHRDCMNASQWASPTVPDSDCSRSEPPVLGCSYPETVFTQYLLPDPTPSLERACLNTSRPLSDSACEGADPYCGFACYVGPVDGVHTLGTEICALQYATVALLQHSDFTASTELFVYGVLLGTLVLIVGVELADPTRTRLITYDAASDARKYSGNIFT